MWVLRNARFAVFCILLDMTFGLLDLDEDHIVHIDAVMKRVLLAVGHPLAFAWLCLGELAVVAALAVRREARLRGPVSHRQEVT